MRASSLILLVGAAAAAIPCAAPAQVRTRQPAVPVTTTLLVPDRVWDGVEDAPHSGWAVLVTGNKIVAAGPRAQITAPAGATTIDLPGTTLMPGLIDAHSHMLLHPYNETSWNDQVLHESLALRTARAVNHVRATLMAGFTTVRDLGTEGAGYADVGLKQAMNQGIIPGPRMFVSTRAIVATGAYGPAGFTPEYTNDIPQGGQEASGLEQMAQVVRDQIKHGADWVKIYADYRWGPNGENEPTFTLDELKEAVDIANSSGRPVTVHATTAEGMRRAILAGVTTIEHGDNGTPEVFKMMADRGICLVPTLAAGDAILQYGGWRKGVDPDPPSIVAKKKSFKAALDAGVTICNGSDVGVFTHGDNAQGNRDARRLRDDARRRAPLGHVDRREDAAHGRPARAGEGRLSGRSDRGEGRSDQRHLGDSPGAVRDEGRDDLQAITRREQPARRGRIQCRDGTS